MPTRNRHYGLLVGDRVVERAFGSNIEGVVVELYIGDNNRGRIRLDDGTEQDIICEWCKIIEPAKEV